MRRKRYVRLFAMGVVAGLAVLGLAPAGASSANISHSFKATSSLHEGSVVSLDPARTGYVVPANVANGSHLLGVVVNGNDSLIALDSTPGEVQVATTGTAPALVSTLNGDIGVGDQVAVSPFNGVGMKAEAGSKVVGLAQTAFTAKTAGATSQTVRTKDGRANTVKVGYISVSIAVGTDATAGGTTLNGLQRFAKSITGHVVPTERIIISIAVAAVATLALITLVYASIYGSIMSIGRNPLAKYAVFRTLGSVMGLALMTTVIAGVIIFFLLR